MKKQIAIPKFKNEDEERKFWQKIDLSEHFESSDFEKASFPNLKPTSHLISIRVPDYLIDRTKEKANEMGVPYQALIKQFIRKGLFSIG